jgi:hypothetical protein
MTAPPELADGYEVCRLCNHVYRPGVESSVTGHRRGTGHLPVPKTADAPARTSVPVVVSDDDRPTSAQLLLQAARTVSELRAVVDGLHALASTWSQADEAVRREDGAMLAGYLSRPPIHPQGGTDA